MTERTTSLTTTSAEQLLVDTTPYLSCDECFELLDTYVERKLAQPAHHDLRLETHLRGCGVCADEVAALTELLGDADAAAGRD